MNFDYRSNAPPYRPVCATPAACLQGEPVFSGLSPGYAGLYQVNFIVPPPPVGTPPCHGTTITSNLTVSLLGSNSFDGAGICVEPGPSSAAVVAPAGSTSNPSRRVFVPDHISIPLGTLLAPRQLPASSQ